MTDSLLAPPALSILSPVQLADLVEEIAADPSLWRPYLRRPLRSHRWWRRLPTGPEVDVWLLSWLPGHATYLHDHGGSAAAFTVVEGELSEVRVDPAGGRRALSRRTGNTVALAPGVIHDVRGAGRSMAASIHAYSAPLTHMTYYEVHPGTGLPCAVRVVSTDEPEQDVAL
jgi:quercetin dioxygenase-like cupin family protein